MEELPLYQIKRSETTRIYPQKGKMLRYFVFGLLFFGACFIGFQHEAGTGRFSQLEEGFLWCASAFIALLIAGSAFKLFDSRPSLEFGDEGLLATEISADVIPWKAIEGASIRSYKKNTFLELQIDPDVMRGLRQNVWRSMLRVANKSIGFPHYYVSLLMLDHDGEFILKLVDSYLREHSDKGATAT